MGKYWTKIGGGAGGRDRSKRIYSFIKNISIYLGPNLKGAYDLIGSHMGFHLPPFCLFLDDLKRSNQRNIFSVGCISKSVQDKHMKHR